MPTNDFLPFCPTDTGTNLLSQSAYAAAPDLAIGNQPGVASSQLVNKALRQGTFMAAVLAQFISNKTNTATNDNANETQMISQLFSAIENKSPVITSYLSGSGNHNISYKFQISVGNATVGATYTNNSVTYTVTKTISSGLELIATGNAAPTTSGTLTKAGGTGDATITFNAVRVPLYLRVRAVGGGGGGSGSGTSGNATAGGVGGDTSFGTTLIVAGGGAGGPFQGTNGAGGSAALGTGNTGIAIIGGRGGGPGFTGVTSDSAQGGGGGNSAFGGAAGVGEANSPGLAGATNSGGGGSGGGSSGLVNSFAGTGGGSGGFVDAFITTVLSTYAWVVGGAGTPGTSVSENAGGAGGAGCIIVEEHYQ